MICRLTFAHLLPSSSSRERSSQMPFDPSANSTPEVPLEPPRMSRSTGQEWEQSEEDGSTWQVLGDHQRPR
jgi:hypothetical protein